jgi:aryl-alcohol dehydrogenase-like predicted oxidoreductase
VGRIQKEMRVCQSLRRSTDSRESPHAAILDEVLAIAKETGTSATQVALAWVLEKARRSTTAIVPIIGPRNREQLDGNLRALSVTLDPEQFVRLEKVSEVSLGVPHEVNKSTATKMARGIPEIIDFPGSRAA